MQMPGTQIPVADEILLAEDQPPYALVFSWHIADSIIPKLRAAGYEGRFIIPLPEPVILEAHA
jgi:C-methyltransferase C-terminal domain